MHGEDDSILDAVQDLQTFLIRNLQVVPGDGKVRDHAKYGNKEQCAGPDDAHYGLLQTRTRRRMDRVIFHLSGPRNQGADVYKGDLIWLMRGHLESTKVERNGAGVSFGCGP